MEKRLILAIVLSVVILLIYQRLFFPEPAHPPPAAKSEQAAKPAGGDNAAPAAAPLAPTAPPVPSPAPPPAQGEMRPAHKNPLRWIRVRTSLYTAVLSTAGGGVQSFTLERYKDHPGPAGKPLNIIGSGDQQPLPLDLYLGESQPAFPSVPVFASDAPPEMSLADGQTRTISLSWKSAGGVRIVRKYTFTGGKYVFDVTQRIANGSAGSVRIKPGIILTQRFSGELGGDSYSFKGAVVDTAGKIERYKLKKIAKGEFAQTPVQWAAADSKYFALVAIPGTPWPTEKISKTGEERIRIVLAGDATILGPKEVASFSVRSFMGPKEYDVLEASGKGLERLVDYGWFGFLAKPLVWVLSQSNRVTGNYGIDIILLTILIKIIFYPLSKKSLASMRKMQELQPILSKIKEKYKNDKQRQQQEMMNLYKTYKINPMGGCLPMVLQIPVFIALYEGLLVAIQLRHAPFFLWINDLSAPEHLWNVVVAGYTIPIRLLPLLMGISMFVQQKMTPSGGMDPTQQKMMLALPVVFTVMFWGFPTGLTIYWLVNNLLSIGQQAIQNRQYRAEAAARAK